MTGVSLPEPTGRQAAGYLFNPRRTAIMEIWNACGLAVRDADASRGPSLVFDLGDGVAATLGPATSPTSATRSTNGSAIG